MTTTTITIEAVPLLRLLQLASPSLPVGAYAYSQGLEWAVEAGWVGDAASLSQWIEEQLDRSLAGVDLPILARLHRSMIAADVAAQETWTRQLLARRETAELRADDVARGRALGVLIAALDIETAIAWAAREDVPFAAPFAAVAAAWQIPSRATLLAYAWGWLENQVLCGIKLIPLGQAAGQRLLVTLAPKAGAAVESALKCADSDIGATLPSVALASCLHETQYTRLFRS